MADLYLYEGGEMSASPFQAVGRGVAGIGRSLWSDWVQRSEYAKMAAQAVQAGDMETGAFLSLRALGIRPENPASIAGGLMGIRGGMDSPTRSIWSKVGRQRKLNPIGQPIGEMVTGTDRPWPGIYKGPISQGRTVPKSYTAPKTFDISDDISEISNIPAAKEFIKQLPEGKLSAFDRIRLSKGGII
jgi:hypothetical protein